MFIRVTEETRIEIDVLFGLIFAKSESLKGSLRAGVDKPPSDWERRTTIRVGGHTRFGVVVYVIPSRTLEKQKP
jgi:hypothetical protein